MSAMPINREIVEKTEQYGAMNYLPLPVAITRGQGVWVWDVEDNKYMDMLSAYSAMSHGHCHPKIVAALKEQADKLTLTSRAFHNDKLCELYERIVKYTGLPKVLPMNTGAEAVETALKAARKWGYDVKGVPEGQAEIIACCNNFHGRTITIISMSTDEDYREGFGPFTPGFKIIEYGDLEALRGAINENTVAFLVEPIQGEAGILIPPAGYMKQAEQICRDSNVLLVADEIQTGFGRTGKVFCCDHEDVHPDIMIMGKALGGGVLPVSAIAGTEEVMGVFRPGIHGSTFGGNPLAAAVGCVALDVLEEEDLLGRARDLGAYLVQLLRKIDSPHVKEIRGKGLLVAVELNEESGHARAFCERLLHFGILAKETHTTVIRLAPPLVITKGEIEWAVEQVERVLTE
jgi:ornithine--oxo-acid transaminase